jgi:pimeloyl-ACP methyl ester carboxylesterase
VRIHARVKEARLTDKTNPVVFIHGLWLHASSWAPWQDFFGQAGYTTSAPGWPGDADTVADTRAKPDDEADHGIDDITNHYATVIDAMATPPILIGHSFGGLIAEKLLGQGRGAGAVAIDAAQLKGVLVLPLAAARTGLPVLKNPRNKHRAITLTPKQFRYSFGNTLSDEESQELYDKWTIPGPGRPLFEAAFAAFSRHSPDEVDTANTDRGPLLLIAGGEDHTVPEAVTKSTLKQYHGSTAVTDFLEFPDRGHSLTIDNGWRDIAGASLEWLEKQGL